jgi:hypothetical protein
MNDRWPVRRGDCHTSQRHQGHDIYTCMETQGMSARRMGLWRLKRDEIDGWVESYSASIRPGYPCKGER